MEPSPDKDDADDLRPEYDFSQMKGWVRGKYAGRKTSQNSGGGYEQTASFPPNGGSAVGWPSPSQQAELAGKIDAHLVPLARNVTTPIWGDHDSGWTGQCGTGTLFRVASHSFLVTASHLIDDAPKDGWGFTVMDAPSSGDSAFLTGRVTRNSEYDVAVIELDAEVVDRIPNRPYLSVHNADRTITALRRGWYMVYGFPSSWAEATNWEGPATLREFLALAPLFDGDNSGLGDYDPNIHVLLKTPRESLLNTNGTPGEMPSHLRGMSGCSIWQVYYEGLSTKHWTPNDARIVAVQTGVYRGGAIIKGTRWWVVDQLIRNAYPDLAGPLDLMLPDQRPVGTA